jgi:hypothetical protein
MTSNKQPEWRMTLDKCVEDYQSSRAWYEENRDSPSALDDMERAEDQLTEMVRRCGFSIVLDLLDEIGDLRDELQGRRKAAAEPIAWLNDAYLARGVVDGKAGSEDAGPGYIPVYREAVSQPVLNVTCWSCRNEVEISAVGDRDGYCPKCNSPIDLDEEPYAAHYRQYRSLTSLKVNPSDADFGDLMATLRGINIYPSKSLHTDFSSTPIVPEEMPAHTGPREFGRPQAYVEGWNACRAAMLYGKKN